MLSSDGQIRRVFSPTPGMAVAQDRIKVEQHQGGGPLSSLGDLESLAMYLTVQQLKLFSEVWVGKEICFPWIPRSERELSRGVMIK